MRLGGSQSRSGHCGEQKNIDFGGNRTVAVHPTGHIYRLSYPDSCSRGVFTCKFFARFSEWAAVACRNGVCSLAILMQMHCLFCEVRAAFTHHTHTEFDVLLGISRFSIFSRSALPLTVVSLLGVLQLLMFILIAL